MILRRGGARASWPRTAVVHKRCSFARRRSAGALALRRVGLRTPWLRAALAYKLIWFHAAAGWVASVLIAIVLRNRVRLAGSDSNRQSGVSMVARSSTSAISSHGKLLRDWSDAQNKILCFECTARMRFFNPKLSQISDPRMLQKSHHSFQKVHNRGAHFSASKTSPFSGLIIGSTQRSLKQNQ